jgi:hypothetical protein
LLVVISGAASAPATGSGLVASSTQADATIVSEWNAIAQTETLLLRPTAHGQMRGMAMVQGAVYDAVNAIDRGRQPYLLALDQVRARRGSQGAAAATAAHRVLLAITPEARHAGLDAAYASTIAAIPDGAAERRASQPGRLPPTRCSTHERMTGSWRPSLP